MTEAELAAAIEASKKTVLQAIGRYLPAELGGNMEDIAQETYLRYFLAFQHKPALEGDDLHRWLYVAAKNETLRFSRKSRREWFAFMRHAPETATAAESELVRLETREEETREIVDTTQVPSPFRETLELRRTGMKLAEIAVHLNVSVGTVKSRLSRGKEWLARHTNSKEAL